MLGLWYYNLQDMFVDYYATSLLCNKRLWADASCGWRDYASAKKLVMYGKVMIYHPRAVVRHALVT